MTEVVPLAAHVATGIGFGLATRPETYPGAPLPCSGHEQTHDKEKARESARQERLFSTLQPKEGTDESFFYHRDCRERR